MAKKTKSKKNNKILIPVILFLLLIVVGTGLFFTTRNTSITCGSTAVLSVDKVDIIDGDSKIRVLSRLGEGTAECMQIRFDKDDIKRGLESSTTSQWEVDKSVTGSFTSYSQSESWQLFKNDGRIYQTASFERGDKTLGCLNSCPNNPIRKSGFYQGAGFLDWTCSCVDYVNYGFDSDIGSSRNRDFNARFEIDGLSPIDLSGTSPSGSNSMASVKWQGDILRNIWIEKPGYDALFLVNLNRWQLIKDGSWSSYEKLRDDFSSFGLNGLSSLTNYDEAQQRFTQFNQNLLNIVENRNNEFKSRNTIINTMDFSQGNVLTIKPKTPTTSGLFIIELDASWVGIRKVSGEPQLNCNNLGDFTQDSGDAESQSFSVKNVGGSSNERASFSLSAECSNGASVRLNKYSAELTGGQSTTVTVTSSGLSNDGIKSFNCDITATDSNNLNNKDTCDYSFKSEQVTEKCSKDVCIGSDLWECLGTGTYKIVECKYGCNQRDLTCYSPTDEICNDGVDNDGDALIDAKDPDCDSPFDLSLVVPIGLGLLSAVFIFFIGRKSFARKKDTIDLVLVAIFSLLVGGLIYFLTKGFLDFITSTMGIIVVVVSFIILIVINRFIK